MGRLAGVTKYTLTEKLSGPARPTGDPFPGRASLDEEQTFFFFRLSSWTGKRSLPGMVYSQGI